MKIQEQMKQDLGNKLTFQEVPETYKFLKDFP